MVIQDVIEVAEWFEDSADVARINRLKDLFDNHRFYVTVWGHYSAGKSMLINNILNKDILPVQTRETTAVLTYIQYGTQEECVIVYENGMCVNHDLDILKDIFQNTSNFEEVGKIDHIEVYVKNDLLSTGLILVDTPGVNTVIQKHQDLAVDAIEQSGQIIYVLGNSPSNIDRQFIKQIFDCGIQISFIRTKCDKFLKDEEGSPEESLEAEKLTIEGFLGCEIDFIPVSNKEGNKWSDNISEVRTMINRIANSISDEMDKNLESRLSVFADKYLEKLMAESISLEQIKIGDTKKMDKEILAYEKDLEILKSIVEDMEKKIERRVDDMKTQSQKELDKLITLRVEDFKKELSQIEPSANVPVEVKGVYDTHLTVTIEKMQKLLNACFEEIVRQETDSLLNNISDKTISLPVPTYAEIQQENSRILELYNSKLLELKREIERIKKERILNGEALSEAEESFGENDYDGALALLEQKLAEIPSGMALRLAEKQDIQPSTIFKKIGNAFDVALLLIPGDVVVESVKSVANTTKIAQTLHKMGKAGEIIVKAGNVVGKNAKVIDRVRDTTYAISQILGKRGYSTRAEKEAAEILVEKAAQKGKDVFESYKENKQSGNVLDALSVAYWTEKIGKKFDSEPRMEIDREEENRRNQMRKQIAAQQQQLSDERINKTKELVSLKDKAEELKLREQAEELRKQRIEEELKKQEQNVIRQARIAALNKYRRDYEVYYGDIITDLANDMMIQYFKVANQNINMYIASQNKEVVESIEKKKSQLEEIRSLKEKGAEEITSKIEKCNEFKMKLELIS